jgi:hypothetical protein
MTGPDFDATIEIVRGEMSEAWVDAVLRIWSSWGFVEGDEARERLSEVVCVLLDGAGEVVGVNSVHAQDVPLIGGRPFWIYRSVLAEGVSGVEEEMISTAYAALEEDFEPGGDEPIGLCLLVDDPAEMERRPQAIWPETELTFAGYLEDGRQVRIRYFREAAIAEGLPDSPSVSALRDHEWSLEDRYRIEIFAEQDAASHDDVLALWQRESAVPPVEAQRRVHEVHQVAIERTEGVVALSTVHLRRIPQLRMDLWYFRLFVSKAHRKSNLAALLSIEGRNSLEQRFVSGEDARAAGIIYEIENEGLKRYFNKWTWLPVEFNFIGENKRGDHIRVHYFPGALVPVPE